ncbi:MAG TPA: aconitate hydratase AcnA, partial [Gemmatimonadales bacterium]
TDLVLTVTEMLRKRGVVGKFVEFCGPGLSNLSLADRATIANMSPEYGATVGFFPVDEETLTYLRRTGRLPEAERVERYCKENQLFHTVDAPDPDFSTVLVLDLGTVVPSLAGPKRPQDLVALSALKGNFLSSVPALLPTTASQERHETAQSTYSRWIGEGGSYGTMATPTGVPCSINGANFDLHDGSVVIAAITSCTNTSNPSVMLGAGLLAKKAVERGLQTKSWVKSSLAPGSRVVSEYLTNSGLQTYLDQLGFQVVGFGCTTCIGNSGPLPDPIAQAIDEHHLVTVAVLSGNRNFEARIHPLVRANYLASPILVVAFALAGRVDLDLEREPLGTDTAGKPVYLKEIWPSAEEIREAMSASLKPELFTQQYALVFDGDEQWRGLLVAEGSRFAWDSSSTYIQEPPFFVDLPRRPGGVSDVRGARVLVSLGDSVTTDHISPAGSIPRNGPAARFLLGHGVEQVDWNTFGARRGNHQVMIRGTFGNVRIRNRLVPDREGNWTVHLPTGEIQSIYDVATRYIASKTPLIVLAGKEYGTGSSRDWAAKGTALLGVRAVIAESYERIHRSNLVGMGVLPLAFKRGESRDGLGLTGREIYDITGITQDMQPGQTVVVTATAEDGKVTRFDAIVRLNSHVELEYYHHGGILPRVLRMFLGS